MLSKQAKSALELIEKCHYKSPPGIFESNCDKNDAIELAACAIEGVNDDTMTQVESIVNEVMVDRGNLTNIERE